MKKLIKSIMKLFYSIYLLASILLILWGFLSWIDIIADNCEPNPVHSDYNLIVMITEIGEKIDG